MSAVAVQRTRLTSHLIRVDNADFHGRAASFNGGWSYFRGNTAGSAFFINCSPAYLSREEIAIINQSCDAEKNSQNEVVKKKIAGALTAYFGEKSFALYDIGSGQFPLSDYFDAAADMDFHAIDIDASCVDKLKERSISASDWPEALGMPHDSAKPVICASSFALHFMLNQRFARNLRELMGENQGFFVGNLHHADPGSRAKLDAMLKPYGLFSISVRDGRNYKHEYYVIGKTENPQVAFDFVKILRERLTDASGNKMPVRYSNNVPDIRHDA